DEVLAVGDADFQKKCLGRMNDIVRRQHRTILFVTHNMAAARAFCTRGLLLNEGKLLFDGAIDDCIQRYGAANDHQKLSVWTRPPGMEVAELGFDQIAVELLGSQPSLTLRLKCSFARRLPHRPAIAAFDIADAMGTALMQAFPAV